MNPAQESRAFPKMNMKPIFDALGDNTPKITNEMGHPTPLGRYRLVQALQNKFGGNYRIHPVASKALEHFDTEHQYFSKLRMLRGIPNG